MHKCSPEGKECPRLRRAMKIQDDKLKIIHPETPIAITMSPFLTELGPTQLNSPNNDIDFSPYMTPTASHDPEFQGISIVPNIKQKLGSNTSQLKLRLSPKTTKTHNPPQSLRKQLKKDQHIPGGMECCVKCGLMINKKEIIDHDLICFQSEITTITPHYDTEISIIPQSELTKSIIPDEKYRCLFEGCHFIGTDFQIQLHWKISIYIYIYTNLDHYGLSKAQNICLIYILCLIILAFCGLFTLYLQELDEKIAIRNPLLAPEVTKLLNSRTETIKKLKSSFINKYDKDIHNKFLINTLNTTRQDYLISLERYNYELQKKTQQKPTILENIIVISYKWQKNRLEGMREEFGRKMSVKDGMINVLLRTKAEREGVLIDARLNINHELNTYMSDKALNSHRLVNYQDLYNQKIVKIKRFIPFNIQFVISSDLRWIKYMKQIDKESSSGRLREGKLSKGTEITMSIPLSNPHKRGCILEEKYYIGASTQGKYLVVNLESMVNREYPTASTNEFIACTKLSNKLCVCCRENGEIIEYSTETHSHSHYYTFHDYITVCEGLEGGLLAIGDGQYTYIYNKRLDTVEKSTRGEGNMEALAGLGGGFVATIFTNHIYIFNYISRANARYSDPAAVNIIETTYNAITMLQHRSGGFGVGALDSSFGDALIQIWYAEGDAAYYQYQFFYGNACVIGIIKEIDPGRVLIFPVCLEICVLTYYIQGSTPRCWQRENTPHTPTDIFISPFGY